MVGKGTFSDDLWDKFEVVCKKVSNGKNFTGTVSKFLQKRAQIESTYAKSLAKLCKDKTFAGDLEIGSSKDCWQAIRDDLEMMANKHDALADETNTLFETIQTYLTEARNFRKTLVANGDKVTKELRAAERKETTAHQNYEKLKKSQEESEEEANKASGSAKEAKAKKNAEAATKKAETADLEYREAVKQLQASQQKFYQDEMPKILDDLQKLEEERIDKMKDWFLRMVALQETVPPAVTTACAGMRKAAEMIDRTNDISQFIAQNRSGTPKPPEAKYEPYVSESPMLSRNGSRMTLAPQNNIVQQQQRVNSSSNFGVSPTPKAAEPIQSPPTGAAAVSSSGAAPVRTSVMTRVLVRALYNYDATEDNELSFKANDRIVVIQKDDSGWWHGELNGQVGIFPSNFVEGDGGAAGPAVTKEEPKTATKCKVLYDYNADSDSELTIKEGDILTIENEDEGWYFGSNSKGDTGRFPSNYVQTM
jgi:chemotaxis protein histidine kinase CheA